MKASSKKIIKRQPEQVWSSGEIPISFWHQLDAYSGRLDRTPYFYKSMAIGFCRLARSRVNLSAYHMYLGLAKSYLHLYREALAKWSRQFGVDIAGANQGGDRA